MSEISIPIDKKFILPNYKIVKYKNYSLAIAHETAKWVVLDNEKQLKFFKLLNDMTLEEALKNSNCSENDAKDVVLQILLTDFENPATLSLEPPMAIHIYVTNGCNLSCPRCYMFSGQKEQSELTKEEICAIVKDFSQAGGKHVTFSGGEPSTRKDLIEIIKFSKQSGVETEVYTNGILWSTKERSFFHELSKVLDYIQISIDGYSEEKNSSIRGEGIFQKVLLSIDRYLEANIKTTLAITPDFSDDDDTEVVNYVNFCKSIIEKYNSTQFRLIVSSRLLNGRNGEISLQKKNHYKELVNRINMGLWGLEADTDLLSFLMSPNIKNNCAYGNIAISADGGIYFCSRINELKPYGNIRDFDFKNVLQIAKEAQKLSRVNNLKPCNECALINICGGDCRIEYFKDFCDCSSIIHPKAHSRLCSQEVKNEFYELMVKSRERLYEIQK